MAAPAWEAEVPALESLDPSQRRLKLAHLPGCCCMSDTPMACPIWLLKQDSAVGEGRERFVLRHVQHMDLFWTRF